MALMRVKSAAPGGRIHGESRRQNINKKEASSKGKMSTLDSGLERKSIDQSTLLKSDKKTKDSGLNQSFY